MVNLDDLEQLKSLDPKDVLGSTEMFVGQCKQVWQDAKLINFPQDYSNAKNIVVCGMGGSAYGGYVASTLFKDSLKIPLVSNNDYHLPSFVSEDSLVMALSYSGSTEEVLSCLEEAKAKGCKIVGMATGGKLIDGLKKGGFPYLQFEPKSNPSGQPRLATGYMVLGVIALLNKLGLISVTDTEVETSIDEVEKDQENIRQRSKELAQKVFGFIPVIFGAEFLIGNIHILRNQFNETAKSFSAYSPLSELNHHLMEGLKNPTDKKLLVLFINSPLYSDKLKKRVELTKDVVSKNGIAFEEYIPNGNSKLSQMLNVLSFGGFLSLYTAFLYGQDPSVIPWVDYFKEQLEKNP